MGYDFSKLDEIDGKSSPKYDFSKLDEIDKSSSIIDKIEEFAKDPIGNIIGKRNNGSEAPNPFVKGELKQKASSSQVQKYKTQKEMDNDTKDVHSYEKINTFGMPFPERSFTDVLTGRMGTPEEIQSKIIDNKLNAQSQDAPLEDTSLDLIPGLGFVPKGLKEIRYPADLMASGRNASKTILRHHSMAQAGKLSPSTEVPTRVSEVITNEEPAISKDEQIAKAFNTHVEEKALPITEAPITESINKTQPVEPKTAPTIEEAIDKHLVDMGQEPHFTPIEKPKPLSPQAQAVRDASEIPIGGSEDATARAVKQAFVKQPDSQYKNMTNAERTAIEAEHQRGMQYGDVNKDGEALDDFGQPMFSKGEENKKPSGRDVYDPLNNKTYTIGDDGKVYWYSPIRGGTYRETQQWGLKQRLEDVERIGADEVKKQFDDHVADIEKERAKPKVESDDYRMDHKAPSYNNGIPAHNLSDAFPDDIYSKDAQRLYGHGDKTMDSESLSVIKKIRSNPSAEVTIYRAVPKNVKMINKGDWVTTSKTYAKQHGEGPMKGDYHVVSEKVKASDLYTDGNSIHEWGYNPSDALMSKGVQGSTTTEAIHQSAKKLLGKNYDNLKGDINIVQSYKDLPKGLVDNGVEFSSGGKVRGIFNPKDGKVHLVADAMKPEEVNGVLVHELLHKAEFAGEKILGESHDTLVLRLKQLADEPLVKQAFKSAKDAGTDAKNINREMMSYLVEKYQLGIDMSPKLKQFVRNIIDAVKVFASKTAVKLGVDAKWLISKMNEKDIAALLKSSAIKQGEKVTAKGDSLFSKAMSRLQEWHKDSHPLTKNEDGTPKVFYHGTKRDFDTFKKSEIGSSTDSGIWGKGFYFGENPDIANAYAKGWKGETDKSNVMPVHLNMKNPLILTKDTKKSIIEKISKEVDDVFESTTEYSNRITKGLIARGYDGVIDKIGGHHVAFEPTQIKSIHNRGTFDETNPNILFSKAKEAIKEVDTLDQPEVVKQAIKAGLKRSIPEIIEGSSDKAIQYVAKKAIKLADIITIGKVSKAIDTLKETKWVNDAIGHKIYEAKDYMEMRENALQNMSKGMKASEFMHNMLKDLSSQAREAMYDYATGYKDVKLTPELKKATDNMIKMIDEEGKKQVANGTLSKEAYEEWKGQYLHRQYASKMNDLKSIASGGRGFTAEPSKQRGKSWVGTEDELHGYEKAGVIGKISDGMIEAEVMPNGKVNFRRDWTREERKNMGEIRDIAYSFPETMGRLTMLSEHGRMLKSVPKQYLLEQGKHTDMWMEDAGYTKLSGAKYGALNGKWVNNTIADDITAISERVTGDEILKGYKEYISAIKASHTIHNYKAHVNNTVSGVIMQFSAGLNPIKAVTYATQGVKALGDMKRMDEISAKALTGMSKEETAELAKLSSNKNVMLVKEADQYGLFGKSQLNSILRSYISPTIDILSTGNKALDTAKKVANMNAKAYEMEDNMMRFSAFKQLREKGMEAKDAVKKVNNDIIPDYSKPMSKWARGARDSGVVPFMSWIYYSTPLLLKQMVEHPTRGLALMGGIMGIDMAFGINPFNEEDMPQDGYAHQNMVIGREGDMVDTMRIQSMIPQSQFIDPYETYVRSTLTGGIPQQIMGSLTNMDLYHGRKITYKDGAEGAYQLGKNFAQNVIPTPDILDQLYNIAESHVMTPKQRRSNSVTQPRTPKQEFLNLLINTSTYDKSKQREKVDKERLKDNQ